MIRCVIKIVTIPTTLHLLRKTFHLQPHSSKFRNPFIFQYSIKPLAQLGYDQTQALLNESRLVVLLIWGR